MGVIQKKAMHILLLLTLLVYVPIWKGVSKRAGLMFLVALLLIVFIIEYWRIEHNKSMKIFSYLFQPENAYTPTRFISFLTAAIICLAVFDLYIAIVALFMTTFGDGMASFIGRNYGRTVIFRNKTLEGSLAGLGLNVIIGIAFLIHTHHIYIPLGMALLASLVELAIDTMDDNLITPLAVSFGGQILIRYLG